MESSDEIIFIALGMLIVIFAGTLALRLGDKLKGINFDKFQNIISDSCRFFILDIWKHTISKETTK